MDLFSFLLGSLATWRVSYMVVNETGPMAVFARLRAFLAAKSPRDGGLYDFVSCPYCVSVWVGGVVALWTASNLFDWFIYTFALSASAIIIDKSFDRLVE